MKFGLRTFHRSFFGANMNFVKMGTVPALFYLRALIFFDLFG
jgi:hypothetical protein